MWRWPLAWDYQRQSQKVLSIFRRTGNMLLAARGHWPLAVPSWEASIKVTFSYIIFSISRITLIMGPWNIMVPWRLESISHLWLSRSFIPNSNLALLPAKIFNFTFSEWQSTNFAFGALWWGFPCNEVPAEEWVPNIFRDEQSTWMAVRSHKL